MNKTLNKNKVYVIKSAQKLEEEMKKNTAKEE